MHDTVSPNAKIAIIWIIYNLFLQINFYLFP
jgi:hypothetical protein